MKIFTWRRLAQAAAIGAVFFLTISHMRFGIEKAAPIDAYCPFGAVEGFLTYLATGHYLQRIYASSFILMEIFLIVTLLFGRVFCSHFCPFGAIQEWLRGLGRKMGIKKDIELPKSVDKYARYVKYFVLAAIAYLSYQAGDLVFRAYDPFNALMHLGEEMDEKIFGYSILAFILIISLFSKNWWCRYACPLGATLGIIKKASPFKISRDENSCISCGTCNLVCPANLDVQKAAEIKSADCVSCLDCVGTCPGSSLRASVFGKTLSKKWFSAIVIATFILPLGIIMLTPAWKTKAPSNLITAEGELNVSNIKGSNTLQYLVDTTKIPFEIFQTKLGLPNDVDKTMKLKDIGIKYGIKNSEGAPIEAEDFRAVVEGYMAENH